MKLMLSLAALLALGGTALANDTCFELSRDARTWSKTPELLCVSNVKDADYTLSLKTGMPGAQQEVLTLHFNLLTRARCIDCNKDVFGVANPSNSIANVLEVQFDGKRDPKTMLETGTVKIGANHFAYRGSAAPPPIVKTPPPAAPTLQRQVAL